MDLVELLDNFKPTVVNGFSRPKRDLRGNVDCFKAKLVVKGFTQLKELISMIHFPYF